MVRTSRMSTRPIVLLRYELAQALKRERPREAAGRSKSFIAGARCERLPATAFRIEELRRLQAFRAA